MLFSKKKTTKTNRCRLYGKTAWAEELQQTFLLGHPVQAAPVIVLLPSWRWSNTNLVTPPWHLHTGQDGIGLCWIACIKELNSESCKVMLPRCLRGHDICGFSARQGQTKNKKQFLYSHQILIAGYLLGSLLSIFAYYYNYLCLDAGFRHS